jgi:hypothetical protein
MRKLPDRHRTARKLLHTLAAAPGTFYQICERAEYDIDDDRTEKLMRIVFDSLVESGHAAYDGLTYTITDRARAEIAPRAPYAGQVAGPAFRGTIGHRLVKIARRAAGAHA